LQRRGDKAPAGYHEALVFSWGSSSLHIANCRFQEPHAVPCIATDAQRFYVRNCEFFSPASFNLFWSWNKQCVVYNCLMAGERNLEFGDYNGKQVHHLPAQLINSTLLSADRGAVGTNLPLDLWPTKENLRPNQVDASASIFDTKSVFVMNYLTSLADKKPLALEEVETRLRQVLNWRDRLNLYAPGGCSITSYSTEPVTVGPRTLLDWNRFWGPPAGDAIEGIVRYQGGDLLSKLHAAPEKLVTEDFRLRPDSAGYRAGKDGKDLGADINLVGPGPAFERWKKTPEYQQWLIDTKQVP